MIGMHAKVLATFSQSLNHASVYITFMSSNDIANELPKVTKEHVTCVHAQNVCYYVGMLSELFPIGIQFPNTIFI